MGFAEPSFIWFLHITRELFTSITIITDLYLEVFEIRRMLPHTKICNTIHALPNTPQSNMINLSAMKKTLLTVLLTAFMSISLTTIVHAQQAGDGVGIGFMVGEPTGLSLKSWTGGNNAFDMGLAWSLGR